MEKNNSTGDCDNTTCSNTATHNAPIEAYVFMGCKHCGKSTQGRALAEKIGAAFYDIDEEIEKNTGLSPRRLYNEKGREAFMEAEIESCQNLADAFDHQKRIVISTGGGICDNDEAIAVLQGIKLCLCGNMTGSLKYVYLRLPVEYSVNRIMENVHETEPGVFSGVPAYINSFASLQEIKEKITSKLTERTDKYEKLADIAVDIKNAPIEENFNTILGALNII